MAQFKPGYQKGDAVHQFRDAARRHEKGERPKDAKHKDAKRRDWKGGQLEMDFAAASAAAAGGDVTNRPPANRQGLPLPGPLTPSSFAGGEDRFEISCRVTWRTWDRLGPTLAALKQRARQAVEERDEESSTCIELPGSDWCVSPKGWRSESRGPVYPFVLQQGGNEMGIANRSEAAGTFYNVRIVLGSIALMLQDSRVLWEKIKREIDDLGGTIERAVPSRVDACVDLTGADFAVAAFVAKFRADEWISRASDDDDNELAQATTYRTRRQVTGFRIGKGIMLRVYDKLEETKSDDAKFQTVMATRWGGLPCTATRVEFQMRREQLKSLGVDTIDDWFAKRADVLAYLCKDWFRFTRKKPDRKNGNQKRAKTWEIWEKVAETFAKWAGAPKPEPLQRVKSLRLDWKQLRAQVTGCATTLAAKAIGVCRDMKQLTAFVVDEVVRTLEAIPERTLFKRIDRKLARFAASFPLESAEPFDREYTSDFVEWFKRWGSSDRKYDGPHFVDQIPNVSEWLGLKPVVA